MDNYSVLMSVYHKEKAEFLREAMDSIWNQTVPTDDFILVCDGPLNEELDSVIAEHEAVLTEVVVVGSIDGVGVEQRGKADGLVASCR